MSWVIFDITCEALEGTLTIVQTHKHLRTTAAFYE